MAKENLGKILMTPKGEYDNSVDYKILDIVTYNGGSYVCKKDTKGNNPTNTEYWQVIAEKGNMPVAGEDYFTEADKNKMAKEVSEGAKGDFKTYYDGKLEEFDAHNYNIISANDDILKALPSEVASGTNITVTDAKECRLIESNIKGKLEQKVTTQGKNICLTDFNDWESGHYATGGAKEDNSARIRLKNLLKVEPNTTYYFSTNSEDYPFVVRTYDSTGIFVSSIGAVYNNTSFTTGVTVNYLSIALYKSGANMNDQTFENYRTYFANGTLKPFICLNSVADKTYEEFSPNSPSPDYPSEIEVVGDNINLFDKDNAKILNCNVNGSDGTLNAFSTTRTLYIPCKPNTKYAISRIGGTRFVVGCMETEPTVGGKCSKYAYTSTMTEGTFETDNTSKYLCVYYYSADTDTLAEEEIRNSIKIEYGNIPTGYTSYGIGGIDYKTVNKNLLPYPYLNTTRTTNGITFTDNGDGTITANGTATANAFFNLSLPTLSAGTYTLSGIPSGGSGSTYFICLGTANFMKDSSFELSEETTYTTCYIRISNGATVNNLVFKPMLEQGTVVTEYVEHQEHTATIELPQGEFLASIGDVKDELIINNDKAKIIKRIGKVVFDGSETWSMVDNTTNSDSIVRFSTLIDDASVVMSSSTSPVTLMCNIFKCYYLPTSYTKECITSHISVINQVNILIDKSRLTDTTVDSFKSWLSEQYSNGTPVEVYYVLANPVEVDLGYIKDLPKTFDGINHIKINDNIDDIDLNIRYVQDIKTYINNLLKDN